MLQVTCAVLLGRVPYILHEAPESDACEMSER